MRMKQRTKWLDVMRCFGIFLIYLGHFPKSIGYAHEFVFSHHVPMFFFAAGCAEALCPDRKFLVTVKKTVTCILLPWLFFALASLVVRTIDKSWAAEKVLNSLDLIWNGTIRNRFFAGSLWFLTCMAVVRVLFAAIRKVRFKWIILVISVASYYVAMRILSPDIIKIPSLEFNADSALCYLVFYGVGYVVFPYINKLLDADTAWKKAVLSVSFFLSVAHATRIFFQKTTVVSYLSTIPGVQVFASVLNALIIIWMYCVLSKLCENVVFFNRVGQNTLYLCGNEYIIKILVPAAVGIVGLEVKLSSAVATYIYCGILIILVTLYLAPVEKRIISFVQGRIESFDRFIINKLDRKHKVEHK